MNSLTKTDVYAIVNAAVREMYGGESTLQAVDTSSFVSVGEHMLRTGRTETLQALNIVFGRTIIGVRPYKGKFQLIAKTPMQWGGIERKISFYATKLEESENFNTDINSGMLDDGQSIDHYKINKVYPLEMNFCGAKTEQKHYTTFRNQLKMAFTSEEEFSKFYSAMMIQIVNDIQMVYEAENRLQVLNAIGATINVGRMRRQVVDLRIEYCLKYGLDPQDAANTLDNILTDPDKAKRLYEYMIERMQGDMALMAENNELFHIYPARNDDSGNALTLLRHTPAEMRRLIMYEPYLRSAEASILPEIFHNNYLRVENYEGVEYWQNPNDPSGISVEPNQLNVSTGQSENGNAVDSSSPIYSYYVDDLNQAIDIDSFRVIGLLFDRDALATSLLLEEVIATPVNAGGDYYNTYYHWLKNFKFDQTENMIVYVMSESSEVHTEG